MSHDVHRRRKALVAAAHIFLKSLDKFKVQAQEKTDLLTALGNLKPRIVGK